MTQHQLAPKFKNIYIYNTWHVTCDTWHTACDTWCGVNILLKCQLPSSYGFGDIWSFNKNCYSVSPRKQFCVCQRGNKSAHKMIFRGTELFFVQVYWLPKSCWEDRLKPEWLGHIVWKAKAQVGWKKDRVGSEVGWEDAKREEAPGKEKEREWGKRGGHRSKPCRTL